MSLSPKKWTLTKMYKKQPREVRTDGGGSRDASEGAKTLLENDSFVKAKANVLQHPSFAPIQTSFFREGEVVDDSSYGLRFPAGVRTSVEQILSL
jgi:hypothetical protein